MKAKFLKLAGVKDEKEFYKKFPTEEAFMAKYGKQVAKLRKAAVGDIISGDTPDQQFNPIYYSDAIQKVKGLQTGISPEEQKRQEQLAALSQSQKSGNILDTLIQNAPQIAQAVSSFAGAKNGKKLKKAQDGVPLDALNYMETSTPAGSANAPTTGFGLDMFSNKPAGLVEAKTAIGGMGKGSGLLDLAKGIAPQLGSILGNVQQIIGQNKERKKQKQYAQISGLVAQASAAPMQQQTRRYVRPEDNLINPINPKGSGTNYLAAENGAEIMNTYAPDVIYTDLGYEPLNDSNKVKAFKKGGKMKKADLGAILNPLSGIGGQLGGLAASAAQGGKGVGPGSQIGSTIGGIAGNLIPIPGVGSLIGSTVGGFLGGIIGGDGKRQREIEEAQKQIESNTMSAAFSQFQNQNKAFMKDGGWVSHDWQPQVITTFGEYPVKQLLKPDPTMDTLRSGGHLKEDYVPVSDFGLNTGKAEYGAQLAMGGDLEVYRGEAETMSYNPYLPNDGETIMFRGPSHEDGGMPISYGENGVEVEGGEPAMVMEDGGKKDSLVVFGNMQIPEYGANEIGDPKAKGMKFKKYIADLSKQEAKQNKTMDKAIDLVNSADATDPFEQLTLNSGQAMLMGTNMKLKELANKKMTTAAVQNAILDTADEYGLESDKVAKMKFKFGGKLTDAPVAQDGINVGGITLKRPIETMYPLDLTQAATVEPVNVGEIAPFAVPSYSFDVMKGINFPKREEIVVPYKPGFLGGVLQDVTVSPSSKKKTLADVAQDTRQSTTPSKKKTDWETYATLAATSAAPFLSPRIVNPLDPTQLAPEMMAAAMNQLEPVPVQQFEPVVPTAPSAISFQDQLNEITAQSRVAERMAAYNPAAASAIFAGVSQAKNKVLAEQFRANQQQALEFGNLRAQILNDAKVKNLAMLDQQMVRQAEARSKTKTQAIEIAKSIADKVAKNKLETLQMQVAQNLYPGFSFTPEGRAFKNPLYTAMFNMAGASKPTRGGEVAPEGYEFETVLKKKKDTGKNGAIVKAFKNF